MVCWYGESRELGQETEDSDTKEPRQDTKKDTRTRRDATVLEQKGRNAAEAARQNEVYNQEVEAHADLTASPRAKALRSSMVTPKVTRKIPIDEAGD
jgi:hypothetical protein